MNYGNSRVSFLVAEGSTRIDPSRDTPRHAFYCVYSVSYLPRSRKTRKGRFSYITLFLVYLSIYLSRLYFSVLCANFSPSATTNKRTYIHRIKLLAIYRIAYSDWPDEE